MCPRVGCSTANIELNPPTPQRRAALISSMVILWPLLLALPTLGRVDKDGEEPGAEPSGSPAAGSALELLG